MASCMKLVPREESPGMPSSKQCKETFENIWSQHYGCPRYLITDRGLHNRGQFARMLSAKDTILLQAALEAPHQIGKVERRGGLWKKRRETSHSCAERKGVS